MLDINIFMLYIYINLLTNLASLNKITGAAVYLPLVHVHKMYSVRCCQSDALQFSCFCLAVTTETF